PPPPTSPPFPYTTLFRSRGARAADARPHQHARGRHLRDVLRRGRVAGNSSPPPDAVVARDRARDPGLSVVAVHRHERAPDRLLRSEEHTSELQSPYDLVC